MRYPDPLRVRTQPSCRGTGRLVRLALVALLSAVGACGEAELRPTEASQAEAPERRVYTREFLFAGALDTLPVAAAFAFDTRPESGGEQRGTRAWLARGGAWDAFLDERWHAPAAASVWQVLPRGALRVAARSPIDPEAIWYRQGERSLRLVLGAPAANWSRGGDTQYRFHPATLTLGSETVAGPLLEVLRVRGPAAPEPEHTDWLVLASGDSVRLVLAHARGGPDAAGQSFAWLARGGEAREWESVNLTHPTVRTLERARRDVPTRWRFAVPGAPLSGTVDEVGSHELLGEERGGQRPVEVRSTVRGWIELDGRRLPAHGAVRHAQR